MVGTVIKYDEASLSRDALLALQANRDDISKVNSEGKMLSLILSAYHAMTSTEQKKSLWSEKTSVPGSTSYWMSQ